MEGTDRGLVVLQGWPDNDCDRQDGPSPQPPRTTLHPDQRCRAHLNCTGEHALLIQISDADRGAPACTTDCDGPPCCKTCGTARHSVGRDGYCMNCLPF